MNQEQAGRRTTDSAWVWLALLPVLSIGWLIFRFMVDVPLVDDWRLAEDLAHRDEGSWGLRDVFRFHNEHRIPASRWLMIVVAEATQWNTRWAAAVAFAIMLGSALLLLRQLRPAFEPLAAIPRAWAVVGGSIALFSAAQFENWLWGFAIPGALGFLGAISALAILAALAPRSTLGVSSEPRIAFAPVLLAVLLATVASWSHGSALVVWPAGLLLLWTSASPATRPQRVAIWIAATLAISAAQLSGLGTNAAVLRAVQEPGRFLYFVNTFLGAPLTAFAGSAVPPRDSGLGFTAGLMGLAGAAIVLRRGAARHRLLQPWERFAVALILLSVGSAILVGLGRFAGGGPEAYASRYGLWSTPLWVGLGAHCARAIHASPSVVRRRLASIGGVVLVAAFSWSSAAHVAQFRRRQEFLEKPVMALHWGEPDYYLASLNPALEMIERWRPYLLKRKLTALRTSRPPRQAFAEPLTEFGARLASSDLPATLRERVPFELQVSVTNTSSVAWPSMGRDHAQGGAVRLASRWFRDGALVRAGERTDLPEDLAPGSSVALRLCLEPPEPGDYRLEISLLQENVAWFSDHDPVRTWIPAEVRPSTSRHLRRPLQRVWKDLTGLGCAP